MPIIRCRYCTAEHGDMLLCAPARRVLDALIAEGMQFDMQTLEFPEPITGPGALGDGTVLCAQIVAKAAMLPVAGVMRPALVLTGLDIARQRLPQWVMPGDDGDLRRLAALVDEMAEMAIRRASGAVAS